MSPERKVSTNEEGYTQYDQSSILELIRSGESAEREELILVTRINTEDSIVDSFHAERLGESMLRKRKQLSPISARAREEEGQIIYDVIDGFHRVEAKRNLGQDTIKATVVYGCDEEELYDLRILASTVRSVEFSRLADWMQKSLESSQWKGRLTLVQIFGLAVSDRETNYRGLTREELQEAKDWAKEKSKAWKKPVTSIHSILRITAHADPELVKRVRSSGGGKDRVGRITSGRLGAAVFALPDNYNAQTELLEYAINERLTTRETEILAKQLAQAVQAGSEEDQDYQLLIQDIVEMNRREYEGEVGPNKDDLEEIEEGAEEEEEESSLEFAFSGEEDPEGPTAVELDEIEEEERSGTGEQKPKRGPDMGQILGTGGSKGRKNVLLPSAVGLDREVERDLRAALFRADETIRKLQNKDDGESSDNNWRWWQTCALLSPDERRTMVLQFEEFQPPEEIADILKIPESRVWQLLRSACSKHDLGSLEVVHTKESETTTAAAS